MNLFLVTSHGISAAWALVYAPDHASARTAVRHALQDVSTHLLADHADLLKSLSPQQFLGTFTAPNTVKLRRVEVVFWVKPHIEMSDLITMQPFRVLSNELIDAPADYRPEDLQ